MLHEWQTIAVLTAASSHRRGVSEGRSGEEAKRIRVMVVTVAVAISVAVAAVARVMVLVEQSEPSSTIRGASLVVRFSLDIVSMLVKWRVREASSRVNGR